MVNLRDVAGQDGTFARKSTQPLAVAYLWLVSDELQREPCRVRDAAAAAKI
jgi:hypothetical protein